MVPFLGAMLPLFWAALNTCMEAALTCTAAAAKKGKKAVPKKLSEVRDRSVSWRNHRRFRARQSSIEAGSSACMRSVNQSANSIANNHEGHPVNRLPDQPGPGPDSRRGAWEPRDQMRPVPYCCQRARKRTLGPGLVRQRLPSVHFGHADRGREGVRSELGGCGVGAELRAVESNG
eukprot:103391-Rhodomonas_salina.1